jgi:hypothetical protein
MHDAIIDGKLAHLGDTILTDAVASATRRRAPKPTPQVF